MITEYIKCSKDYLYFIEKYVYIDDNNGNMVPLVLYDFQKKILDAVHNNKFVIGKVARQSGKALALDTDVLTSSGWKKFGDVHVGDELFDRQGKRTKITFETEVMYNRRCYKLVFDNGEEIVADAEHLWTVSHSNFRGKERVMTTEQIVEYMKHKTVSGEKGSSVYINQLESSCDFERKELPIDPYLLGVWLGDGFSDGGRVVCHSKDFIEYSSLIEEIGHRVEYVPNNTTFRINGLTSKLRSLGVKDNKHIPELYLFSSYEQRLELLQGLMDTDGSVDKNGKCEFYQKDIDFIEDFRFLLSGLGIKSRVRQRTINGCQYYTVSFNPKICVFKLRRKASRMSFDLRHAKNDRHYIHEIIPVETVPVKCIQVDNPESLFLIGKTLIPTHNTTCLAGYIVWAIIFKDRYKVGVAAHIDKQATEIVQRIQSAYELIPYWMQQGVTKWDQHTIWLENGSNVESAATTIKTFRGKSKNFLMLDEFSHVEPNIAAKFYTSVLPSITKGDNNKMVIISTPNGLGNRYHELWVEAERGDSDYVPVTVAWNEIPGRDEAFRQEILRNMSEEEFMQEYACDFLGSSGTLIPPSKLKALSFIRPDEARDNISFFKRPERKHTYMIAVDVCRGKGLDYHAVVVIDITEYPYEVVATYKDNNLDTMLLPSLVMQLANMYNEAYVLVELNDTGKQVSDILYYELEYENVLSTKSAGRSGQILTVETGTNMGVTTTKPVKAIGCGNLKSLVVNDKLILNDIQILEELTTFEIKKDTYKAREGAHDDLCMALVIFAWASSQPYFMDLTDMNIRQEMFEKRIAQMEEDLVPFGFMSDDYEDDVPIF